MNEFISIIIANYNGEKYLSLCIRSVLASVYENFEVIIFDDGSTDNSKEILTEFKKKDKRIQLVINDRNIGAAAARNKAIKYAKGEVLIFLDNDTEVDKKWINEMVDTLQKNEKYGACQAKLMEYKNPKAIQVAGVKLWAPTGWGLAIGVGEKESAYKKIIQIAGLSAALAVKKHVFEVIGGFDEEEAVVTEDLDLSWRIWIAGYEVVLAPNALVYHWTKTTEMRKNMKHDDKLIYFHLTKNSVISILKNYETQNAVKYFIYCIFISFGRALYVLLKRKDISAFWGMYKAFLYLSQNINLIYNKRKIIQKNRIYSDQFLFERIILKRSIFSVYKSFRDL